MNIKTAEWCHNELRENLPGPAGDARDALDDVIKLHAPVEEWRGANIGGTYLHCDQCFNETVDDNWPCSTIIAINAYAHVDLPTA